MIIGNYSLLLVVVSVALAVIASYTAFNIVERLIAARGLPRGLWLFSGAVTLGCGIWSMHFVAMLAYQMDMPVNYNSFLVFISVIFSIAACLVAFYIVSLSSVSLLHMGIGSLFIAAGIVSMHYIGMAAMEMPASITYDPLIFSLSCAIALVTSFVALFLLRHIKTGQNNLKIKLKRGACSLLMGIAISGMHYTGMAAVRFTPILGVKPDSNMPLIGDTTLAISISLSMAVVMGITFISIYFDRSLKSREIEMNFIDDIYQSVIMTAGDAIVMADESGKIISWNPAAARIFDYDEKEAVGQRLDLIIPEGYREAHNNGMNRYLETEVPRVMGKTLELQGLRKNRQEFPIELSLSTLKKEGKMYFTAIIRDISERTKSQNKINDLVYRDALTDLPNRRLLIQYLKESIEKAGAEGRQAAVLFIDLDRFKAVNDMYGHTLGDDLLIEAAARMKQCLKQQGILTRQSGDEFIAVLPDAGASKAESAAKAILTRISEKFSIQTYDIYLSASIGVSIYPEDGTSPETLIKNADLTMYKAKERGKNNFQFFTEEMNDELTKKLRLETGLRKAIDHHEFELHYQPQVDVQSGKISGMEALIRWNHAELGRVSPAEFIPIAEESGLILPIGDWVIREACRQAKYWQEEYQWFGRICINISALQFRQEDFAEKLSGILKETEMKAKYVELELTESMVQNTAHALPLMKKLKSTGIRFSLDDFGTGYSSLSYLNELPLDTLKIDKSFTDTINLSVKDAVVINTIINMAENLALNVIAEGVETDAQLNALKQKHCQEYQGFLYSKPLPAGQASRLFTRTSYTNA